MCDGPSYNGSISCGGVDMASIGSNKPRTAIGASKSAERRFFGIFLTFLAAAVVVGFAPSFFARGIVPPYAPLRPLRAIVVVHGLLAASWMLLFPLQAWLISAGKRALHMRLGKIGFAIASTMVASTYLLAIHLYHEPAPPGLSPALNVVLPLTDFFTLLVLLPIAWRWRFDMQAHKRIMVVIACLLAGAAIFRLPFGDRTSIAGFVVVHLALYATILPLWLWDLFSTGRLHRATMIASGIVAVDMFGRLLIATTPAWAAFVAALPGFGAPLGTPQPWML